MTIKSTTEIAEAYCVLSAVKKFSSVKIPVKISEFSEFLRINKKKIETHLKSLQKAGIIDWVHLGPKGRQFEFFGEKDNFGWHK